MEFTVRFVQTFRTIYYVELKPVSVKNLTRGKRTPTLIHPSELRDRFLERLPVPRAR